MPSSTSRRDAGNPSPHDPHHQQASGRYLATLSLVTLGVVYGDIGTSPLYALRESFIVPHAVTPTHDHVLGVLSLVLIR